MMEEYLDHLICYSSWADDDAKKISDWGCSEPGQPNVPLLGSPLRLYEDDKRNSSISLISSNQIVDCLSSQNMSSLVIGNESDHTVEKGQISGEVQPQKEVKNCSGNPLTNGMMSGSLKVGSMDPHYENLMPSSQKLGYPNQLSVVGDLASSLSFNARENVRCNATEEPEYHGSCKDLQNPSPNSQLWPSPSYEGDTTQGFGFHGGNLGEDADIIAKRSVSMNKILQLDKLSSSITIKGKEDLQNHFVSSFMDRPNITVTTTGLSSLPQTTSAASAGNCNGTGKPRVRARRGQATDPHSIAERLRREKIAERMKNLQQLVPSSNKVDKASMLDEIIEYVKFLQLQVKVLSMSRLGAAGAVIPLITDGQAEGSNSLSLSPSAGRGIDISPSPDQLAFEEEVLKLMESNVNMAMQYLQSKGLCLMPIALAAAISSGKTSLIGTGSEDSKKFGFTNGIDHNSSSSSCSLPGIETCQMSCDGNMMTGKLCSKDFMVNGCNGAVKHEEVKNTYALLEN